MPFDYFLFKKVGSDPTLSSLRNRVIESITLSKLVIIMFSFVSFVKIQVILRKEMIMVLGAYQVIWVCVFTLIWVEKCCFILTKLIVVIFIVEIFVGLLGSSVDCWPEIIDYFLKSCLFGSFHHWLLRYRVDIDI